jgi:hypothetical protein
MSFGYFTVNNWGRLIRALVLLACLSLLSACEVDTFTLEKALLPDAPVALNQVLTLDFEFTPQNTDSNANIGNTNQHENTIVVVQVPANWVIVAGYLGGRDGNGLQRMPRIDVPAGLSAETGLAAPMQLVAFQNIYHSSSLQEANGGRLLVIPGANPAGGVETFGQNIKAVYGKLDADGAFDMLAPSDVVTGDFADVPLPTLMPSLNLQSSGATLEASGESPAIALTDRVGQTLKFTLPAQENLLNRYAYRVFVSHSPSFGGVPLPVGRIEARAEAGDKRDTVTIQPEFHDASQNYYIDLPVHPGHELSVTFNSYLWPYIKALPLTAHTDAPIAVTGAESDRLPNADYVVVSGHLKLPAGHVAPSGGIGVLVAGNYLWRIPEGASSIAYSIWTAPNSVLALRATCRDNCPATYFSDAHFYHPDATVVSYTDAAQLDVGAGLNDIDVTLSTLEPVDIRGTISLGGNDAAPQDGVYLRAGFGDLDVETLILVAGQRSVDFHISGAVSSLSNNVLFAQTLGQHPQWLSAQVYYSGGGSLVNLADAPTFTGGLSLSGADIVIPANDTLSIAGTLSLPPGFYAPDAGTPLRLVMFAKPSTSTSTSSPGYAPYLGELGTVTIAAGQNSAAYRIDNAYAPPASSGQAFIIAVSCLHGCDGVAQNLHYYSTDGSVTDAREATSFSGVASLESIDMRLNALQPLHISGTIALPPGSQPADADIEFIVSLPGISYFNPVTLPATASAVTYEIHDYIAPNQAITAVSVRCRMNCAPLWQQQIWRYYHYYNSNGTVTAPEQAESLGSAESYSGIDIQLAQLDPFTTGALINDDLAIEAVIQTVERPPISARWRLGGAAETSRGDKVIWGYFYADPTQVTWGNSDNPEVFVKIWFDVSGRVDVNYFHVSVPQIDVHTAWRGNSQTQRLNGTTNMSDRYVRHFFNSDGTAAEEVSREDGASPAVHDFPLKQIPHSYPTIKGLAVGSLIATETADFIDGVWFAGGQADTARGDKVGWGYFSANPAQVEWGNANNPEVFVKIWFDMSGRIDVNYFHVSVPDIGIYSDYTNTLGSTASASGLTRLDDRYTRHQFWAY